MKQPIHTLLAVAITVSIGLLGFTGCGDDENTNNSQSGQGKVVMLMHDAPVDDFKEIWLTVNSVTLLSDDDDTANAETVIILNEAVRADLLTLDSVALVLASNTVNAGGYSKIRLQVSNPRFVRNDDSVFTEPDVKLVANGHVDLNFQGTLVVEEDAVNVISVDLDLDNSIQINQTGNGRYILRPQIFVDAQTVTATDVVLTDATVVAVDLNTGTVMLELTGSQNDITVITTGQTEVLALGGVPINLTTGLIGTEVTVIGVMNMDTGVVTAVMIQMEA